jgi:phosphatidylglycerophosphate synthase
MPLGQAIAALGVSANAISVAALVIAGFAAVAFASGHFGVAALIATMASLADGLDGLVARLAGTKSRFGQVLDTMIDRYVDALFLGGIAICVHQNIPLLLVALCAIVGSFMVSYASSVERELDVVHEAGKPGAMRRSHRLVYLITGAAVSPLVERAAGDASAGLIPVFVAVLAIAVVGNVTAVRRLLAAARIAAARESPPASDPEIEAEGAVSSAGTGARR